MGGEYSKHIKDQIRGCIQKFPNWVITN